MLSIEGEAPCPSSSSRLQASSERVNAEEALELVNALFEHTSRANSTLAYQLALRIDAELQRAMGMPTLELARGATRAPRRDGSRERRAEERTRLSQLRSAIWSAEMTDDGD